jgi:hypothetical protein
LVPWKVPTKLHSDAVQSRDAAKEGLEWRQKQSHMCIHNKDRSLVRTRRTGIKGSKR